MPYVNLNGHEAHYTSYQPSQKTSSTPLTIIFVHGLGSTQNFWGPILPYLDSYNVIVFDNQGAGRSALSQSAASAPSIPNIAKDVAALLDHLKVEKAVVVGYSMGGMVPTTFAADPATKSRIISGILVGPVHPTEAVGKVFADRIEKVGADGVEVMANMVPTTATNPNSTPLQKSFIREMILASTKEGYIANCKAIKEASVPKYADVECPILILAGEYDKSAPVEGCKHIHEQLLNVKEKEMKVLGGIGHWFCVEDPEAVGKNIQEWCRKFH